MNRTVRCRWCYKSGHNRLSCPQMKEEAAKNPNSYAASVLVRVQESKKLRKCSYCSEGGHNRKTCKKIFEDSVKILNANKNFRKKFLDTLKEKCIGVGALVKVHKCTGYDSKKEWVAFKNELALITDISIDNTNCLLEASHHMNAQFLSVKEYDGSPANTTIALSNSDIFEPSQDGIFNRNNYHTWEIVSPGHLMIDDEQKFLNCENVVEHTLKEYQRHRDITHVLSRCKFLT